jgi:D-alanyl-lipoteichoic acid acyltransferase DltB (MBOAT superfamily)
MQAGTAAYLTLAAVVFFLFWAGARSRLLRLSIILTANLVFCSTYSVAYLLILPACATLDFLVGLGLARNSGPFPRRLLLSCSVALNVALLVGIRAYPERLLTSADGPDGLPTALALGVSFYALQSLTYTIDLYRKDGVAVSGVLRYFSAATFFPTLEAGPIARLTDVIGQFSAPPRLSREDGARALLSIGIGVAKKALVADFIAQSLVNRVFDTPRLYSGFEVLMAVYGYSLQIYYDFSGYTDIARGVGILLGIQLPANFNRPYAAANLTDFWRRWHMSFSSWLRDYLFFSLPGARTKLMPYVNLVITMVVAGLWHGLSATFALWGLSHGIGLAATRAWWAFRGRSAADTPAGRFVGIFFTYHFVCLTWILFRSGSLEIAVEVFQRILSLTFGWENLGLRFWLVLGVAGLALCIGETWRARARNFYVRSPFYVQAGLLTAVAIAVQMLNGASNTPFVYSQF